MPKSTDHSQGIIRVQKNRDNPYVMMNARFLSDERMSWKAKGILAYLLSKPDSWQVQVGDLVKRSTEGRDANYAGLNELKRCGYLVKEPVRENGKVIRWDSTVYENPIEVKPARKKVLKTRKPHTVFQEVEAKPVQPFPDFPDLVLPETEKPQHSNIDLTKYGKKVITDTKPIIPSFSHMAEREIERLSVERIIEQTEIDGLNLDAEFPGITDAVKEAISDMYQAPEVVVRGRKVPQDVVRGVLAKTTQDGIKHAVKAVLEAGKTTEIRNPKKYLMAAIYDGQTGGALRDAIDFNRSERY